MEVAPDIGATETYDIGDVEEVQVSCSEGNTFACFQEMANRQANIFKNADRAEKAFIIRSVWLTALGYKLLADYSGKSYSWEGPYQFWMLAGLLCLASGLATGSNLSLLSLVSSLTTENYYRVVTQLTAASILGPFLLDWLLLPLIYFSYNERNFPKSLDSQMHFNLSFFFATAVIDLVFSAINFKKLVKKTFGMMY